MRCQLPATLKAARLQGESLGVAIGQLSPSSDARWRRPQKGKDGGEMGVTGSATKPHSSPEKDATDVYCTGKYLHAARPGSAIHRLGEHV